MDNVVTQAVTFLIRSKMDSMKKPCDAYASRLREKPFRENAKPARAYINSFPTALRIPCGAADATFDEIINHVNSLLIQNPAAVRSTCAPSSERD